MNKAQTKRLAGIIRRYVRTVTTDLEQRLAGAERRARDAEERARHVELRVDGLYERMLDDDRS